MADVDDLWYRTGPDGDRIPTSRHGKGKRWQARWRDPDGRQRKASFDRKLDAERHLSQVVTAIARGTYIDPTAGKVTLRTFAAAWQASQSGSATTLEAVERRLRIHILPHLGDVELGRLRPSMINSWLAGLRRGMSDGYARLIYATLSAILSAAVEDDLIGRNPCRARTVQRPPLPKRKVIPWSAERVAAMAAEVGDRLSAMVTCGAGQGLRQGELFALAVEDVDFLRRTIHVRRQVKIVGNRLVFGLPKGGKTRDVPLADTIGLALSAHIAEFPPVLVTLPWEKPDGKPVTYTLLFTRPSGKPWDRREFNRAVWQPALRRIGVTPSRDDVTGMHALRHFAASVWLAGGSSVNEVAAYLGHSDPAITLRVYAHLMPSASDRMRRSIDETLGACAPNVPRQVGESQN